MGTAADRIEQAMGLRPQSLSEIPGGLTQARCLRATFNDGRTAFVKVGQGDSAADVRHEAVVLRELKGPCLPALLGFADGDEPLLICEDLGAARWDVPFGPAETAALMEAIDSIADLRASPALPRAAATPPDPWPRVPNDPSLATLLDIHPDRWPELVAAVSTASLRHWRVDSVVHGDLGPGNWCLAPRGWVFTDWAAARIGDARLDIVTAALRLRGTGITVEAPVEDLPGIVSLLAGYLLCELASLPADHPATPSKLNDTITAIRWASELLQLPDKLFSPPRTPDRDPKSAQPHQPSGGREGFRSGH